MADWRASGRSIEFRDAMIASIALTRRAPLATCNTEHFQDIGLDLVDPEAEHPH